MYLPRPEINSAVQSRRNWPETQCISGKQIKNRQNSYAFFSFFLTFFIYISFTIGICRFDHVFHYLLQYFQYLCSMYKVLVFTSFIFPLLFISFHFGRFELSKIFILYFDFEYFCIVHLILVVFGEKINMCFDQFIHHHYQNREILCVCDWKSEA